MTIETRNEVYRMALKRNEISKKAAKTWLSIDIEMESDDSETAYAQMVEDMQFSKEG